MDYSELERELYENRDADLQIVWIIADHDNEDILEYDSYELAKKGFTQMLKGDPDADIELGWMYEHEKCHYAHKDFKQCFNSVEDIKHTA